MKYLLFILSLALLIGCKKDGYEEFDNSSWEKESYFDFVDEMEGSLYGDALIDNKIVRIQSLSQLDSIGSLSYFDLPAKFSSFDFTNNNLFIVLFNYEGKDHEEATKSKVLINESTNSILFDFKVKVKVGGSGMENWSSLYYFTVPLDKSSYDITGTIEMNEKSAVFQNDDHDFTESYSLF